MALNDAPLAREGLRPKRTWTSFRLHFTSGPALAARRVGDLAFGPGSPSRGRRAASAPRSRPLSGAATSSP
eukprot:1269695-Alexandrium_andersonii.AAC.1